MYPVFSVAQGHGKVNVLGLAFGQPKSQQLI